MVRIRLNFTGQFTWCVKMLRLKWNWWCNMTTVLLDGIMHVVFQMVWIYDKYRADIILKMNSSRRFVLNTSTCLLKPRTGQATAAANLASKTFLSSLVTSRCSTSANLPLTHFPRPHFSKVSEKSLFLVGAFCRKRRLYHWLFQHQPSDRFYKLHKLQRIPHITFLVEFFNVSKGSSLWIVLAQTGYNANQI